MYDEEYQEMDQPDYPEPVAPGQYESVDLDLDAVPHEELDDIDAASEQLLNMDISIRNPTQQSIRTGLRFTKEQLLMMSQGMIMYLPPIRCRCNRVIARKNWDTLWNNILENYETYADNPGRLKQLMDELGIPERECCRISYTTPILITETKSLPGVIMDRIPRYGRDETGKECDLDASHKVMCRRYELTKMGHTYDW